MRRMMGALPSFLLFTIGLFVAISVARPPPDVSTEELDRRFWHLPLLVNIQPADRPRIVERTVKALVTSTGEDREQELQRLLRIGAAGLPDIVAALEKLDPPTRARVARDLAPLAFRMGLEDVTALEDPNRSAGYWAHVLDDRAADLRPSSVRRALSRHLGDRAEPLYARQLRNADTAVLAPIFDELRSAPAERRDVLEELAKAALRHSGVTVRDDAELHAYWAVHRADYVEFGTLERIAARFTETRFGRWIVQAVTQRFGASWRTGQPVLDDLARRAPLTLARAVFGLLLAYLVAVPLGVLSAARRGGVFDRTTSLLVLVAHAVPAFVLALLARSLAPRLARTDAFAAVALALVAIGPISRHLRSRLLEELSQDHVRTARAMGFPSFSVWTRDIGRNALGPVLSYGAITIPLMIGATLLAEEILALDGLGPAAIAAVQTRDVPWLMAFGVMAAILGATALLCADVLQAWNDPRVRRTLLAEHPEDA